MNWITVILLFAGFSVSEFISIKGLYSVIDKKVWLSGMYCLIEWVIYLFGLHEFLTSIYYAAPIILGSVLGTMLAVYLKKKQTLPKPPVTQQER